MKRKNKQDDGHMGNIFASSKEERKKSMILEEDQVRNVNQRTNEHNSSFYKKIQSFSEKRQ